MPPDAVQGGQDIDGAPQYVGRAFHRGDMLVAKVIPSKHIAYVSWRGEEIEKSHFEVLCGSYLEWRQCYNHMIPESAVLAGKTQLDQPVYVGRGTYDGVLTIGRISSVHRTLFVPFGGAERRVDHYEILVDSRTPLTGWLLPPKVESPLPIEELELKMVPMPMPSAVPPYPLEPSPFEPPPPYPTNYPAIKPSAPYSPVPTPTPLPPKPATNYYPPPPPPVVPPMYCPPAHRPPPPPPTQYYPAPPTHYYPQPPSTSHQANIWVTADASYMPQNAVHAGHDADLSTLYVCRAFHEGETIPGKLIPNRGVAYISYGGQEHAKGQYEVLVGEPHLFTWVGACDGSIVPGAVKAGRTRSGESLYVGRTHFSGTLTPGKIQPSHGCIYIPYGGSERRMNNYEVLVRRNDYYGAHTKAPLY